MHITTVHPRNDVRIFKKECVTLAAAGYDVTLVVADGLGDASESGVTIRDIGAAGKVRVSRALVKGYQAMRVAMRLAPKIIHFHDPELLIVALLPRFMGIKVVYDIHENTRVQISLKHYIPRLFRKGAAFIFGHFEDFVARRLAALVVPQQTMLEQFQALASCINLPNYVDIDVYPSSAKCFAKPVVFHPGGLTRERGLDNMIAAANLLGARGEVLVAGTLPADYPGDELGQLKWLGQLSYSDVLSWYARANIGLIAYNNVGQYHMAGAVKSFEYMAASMPIIMPDFGEWVEFNRKSDCGINVNVKDPYAIVKAIQYLVDNPNEAARLGRNGRDCVEREYSWQSVSPRLLDLYNRLVNHDAK